MGWGRWKAGIFFVQGSAWWRNLRLANSRTTPPVRQDRKERHSLLHPGLTYSLFRRTETWVTGQVEWVTLQSLLRNTGPGPAVYHVQFRCSQPRNQHGTYLGT